MFINNLDQLKSLNRLPAVCGELFEEFERKSTPEQFVSWVIQKFTGRSFLGTLAQIQQELDNFQRPLILSRDRKEIFRRSYIVAPDEEKAIFLHRFGVDMYDGPRYHDHDWDSLSFGLLGFGDEQIRGSEERRRFKGGDVLFRSGYQAHRFTTHREVFWTLFVRGRSYRTSYFYNTDGSCTPTAEFFGRRP